MKKTFITGLITLLPIALTIFLFSFIIDLLTTPFLDILGTGILDLFKAYLPYLPKDFALFFVRILILVLLVALTCLIGLFATQVFFSSLIGLTQTIFSKIPGLRNVFKVATEIAKALFCQEKTDAKAFKHPVMVPFPSDKSGCIGFVSGSIPKECEEKVANLVPVFVPTSPHPISGYMMMVPKESVHNIAMSNEDAVKFTVSCGMIHEFEPPKSR